MQNLQRRRRRRMCLVGVIVALLLVLVISLSVGLSKRRNNNEHNNEHNNNKDDISSEPTSSSTTSSPSNPGSTPPITTFDNAPWQVWETFPHDATAFTQGLEVHARNHSLLWKSTGRRGRSTLRLVETTTGRVLEQQALDDAYFGEGLTQLPLQENEWRILQLTWTSGVAFLYNCTTNLQPVGQLDKIPTTTGQGWGIAANFASDVLYVSDGSKFLHLWHATSLQDTGIKVPVRLCVEGMPTGVPVDQLNELEWDSATQTVLANVWQTAYIVRIDPTTGCVTHRYDLSTLASEQPWSSADVLNGIAKLPDSFTDEFYITGKLWPNLYRVQLSALEKGRS